MVYHPIIFVYKKISSSADTVETVMSDQMSLHSDPELEDSKPIFLHDTWCCITIPSLVTEDSAAEEISSRWTLTGILNLFCDLDQDYNSATQSFHKTIHLMMKYQQTKFSGTGISSSGNTLKCHILIMLSLTVTLTLRAVKQSFLKDNLAHNDASPHQVWYNGSKKVQQFKKLFSSENIVERIIFWPHEPSLWPWPWR